MITLLLLVRSTYIWCCSSRTSRSWWITHSTQRQQIGCNSTLLWPMGNCIASSRFVWMNIVFCLWYVPFSIMSWLLYCSLSHNLFCHFSHLCACLICSTVHTSTFHPFLAQHHLCYCSLFLLYWCFLFCMLLYFNGSVFVFLDCHFIVVYYNDAFLVFFVTLLLNVRQWL